MAERSRFGLHMGNTTITLSTLKVMKRENVGSSRLKIYIDFFFLSFVVVIAVGVLQEGKSEIVASKFGDRSSYACIAATENNEFCVGLPAKQGVARNGTLTVVNNFQFLCTDLTPEQIQEAISNTCLCKVNNTDTIIEYELSKNDDHCTKITPFDVAVHLLKNTYGMEESKTKQSSL